LINSVCGSKRLNTRSRAGTLSPADPEIQTGLGIAYLMVKRAVDAVSTLKRTVQLAPSYVKAHFWLGAAYVANGDRVAARAECQALKALDKQKGVQLCRIVDAR